MSWGKGLFRLIRPDYCTIMLQWLSIKCQPLIGHELLPISSTTTYCIRIGTVMPHRWPSNLRSLPYHHDFLLNAISIGRRVSEHLNNFPAHFDRVNSQFVSCSSLSYEWSCAAQKQVFIGILFLRYIHKMRITWKLLPWCIVVYWPQYSFT